jgi:hypothetical protein
MMLGVCSASKAVVAVVPLVKVVAVEEDLKRMMAGV